MEKPRDCSRKPYSNDLMCSSLTDVYYSCLLLLGGCIDVLKRLFHQKSVKML